MNARPIAPMSCKDKYEVVKNDIPKVWSCLHFEVVEVIDQVVVMEHWPSTPHFDRTLIQGCGVIVIEATACVLLSGLWIRIVVGC